MPKLNYWDKLMEDEEHAGSYMLTYGEGPGFETRHALGSFINDGESVLDVGCGPGWNLDHFDEYGPRVSDYLGMDYAMTFVNAANARWKQIQEEKDPKGKIVEFFRHGDVRDIKQPDASWDVVVMQDVLEHTNGIEKPITEALRVAKKRVIITFWRLQETEGHTNDDGDDGWGSHYDRHEVEKFLTSTGYSWMDTDVEPKSKHHPWKFYIIEKDDREFKK